MNTDRKEAYLAILKRVVEDHPEWTTAKQKFTARKLTDKFLSEYRKGKAVA